MTDTSRLVEHFFRHEYGRLVAVLMSQLGVRNLELVEDVVQTALSRALLVWPRSGTPDDPAGWLYRTAKNSALDALRRQAIAQRAIENTLQQPFSSASESWQAEAEHEIGDETLRLLYLTCHPILSPDSRIALALKLVCGFGIHEIACGLLTTPSNIEKRLTRAKERLREQAIEITELNSMDLLERRESVLSTIYLIFNEGFSSTCGDEPIRVDLCHEAIRLTRMIASHSKYSGPAVSALLSLLLLHSARLDSRLDSSGAAVLLADQDRSLWKWDWIREAMWWAEKSAYGAELSRYHIEAAIAWEHCRATDFSTVNWTQIARLYSMLLQRFTTPMIRLNAAVAQSYVNGPEIGRVQLLAIDGKDRKRLHPWWDCCMAQLHERSGDPEAAYFHWRDALVLATAPAQKRFIQCQIDRISQSKGMFESKTED